MNEEPRVYEVPVQLDRLEQVCEHLLDTTEKLGVRCISVLNPTPVDGKVCDESKEPVLCPLAARLRTCARHIEAANLKLNALMECVEL